LIEIDFISLNKLKNIGNTNSRIKYLKTALTNMFFFKKSNLSNKGKSPNSIEKLMLHKKKKEINIKKVI